MRLKSTRGERADLQGGRILRSTGRKDRHSKICTAKGPKDRRLRLSAHTAIQFYDVQDRLGCDRPSEAIDWLMKEAKSAIDALESAGQNPEQEQGKTEGFRYSGYGIGNQSLPHLNKEQQQLQPPINSFSFFLPSSSSGFRNEGNSNEFHHHLSAISSSEPQPQPPPMSWSQAVESGDSQRMISWNYNSHSNMLHNTTNIAGQDQLFSRGGTLQSSFSPSFLALMNSPISNEGNYDQIPQVGPTSNPFSTGDGFPGYFVSHGIQGGEEKRKPVPNKTSPAASSLLHYQN
ncbi:hypothetical protein RHMOL_Rhmol02G0158700 [Rhododendron molle]|uniref:Uncharacterized protein n=1 Tax=Rhododendron molle TaxID=49168 RepID=A0ACC0PTP8_RHOML|nr:hypothetical protein RHMOL_Rhmol02G0158700 [Rhododendron molle]